jgi:hypothetical protein
MQENGYMDWTVPAEVVKFSFGSALMAAIIMVPPPLATWS